MPAAARPRLPLASGHAGFTLVELAVVLAVLGVLGIAMTSAFTGVAQDRDRNTARAQAEVARQALRTFALRNQRLPCPDTSAAGDSGHEGGGSGCAAGVQVGWLPYLDLDLDPPVRGARLRYGVHRGAGADLAVLTAGSDDLDGNAAFRRKLAQLAGTAPSSAHPYYGTPAASGTPDCVEVRTNPAFVLVAPLRDQDGVAAGFDGANQGFGDGSRLCTAAPDQPGDARYDDVVAAEGASSLLGWIARPAR